MAALASHGFRRSSEVHDVAEAPCLQRQPEARQQRELGRLLLAEGGEDHALGRDDVEAAFEQRRRQARAGGRRQGTEDRRHGDLGCRVAAEQRLQRAPRLAVGLARRLDAAARGLQLGSDDGHVEVGILARRAAHVHQLQQLGVDRHRLFGERQQLARLDAQEPALGHQRGQRFARPGIVQRDRLRAVVGGLRVCARSRPQTSSSQATPT